MLLLGVAKVLLGPTLVLCFLWGVDDRTLGRRRQGERRKETEDGREGKPEEKKKNAVKVKACLSVWEWNHPFYIDSIGKIVSNFLRFPNGLRGNKLNSAVFKKSIIYLLVIYIYVCTAVVSALFQ